MQIDREQVMYGVNYLFTLKEMTDYHVKTCMNSLKEKQVNPMFRTFWIMVFENEMKLRGYIYSIKVKTWVRSKSDGV